MGRIYETYKFECSKKGLIANEFNAFTQYLRKIKENMHMIIIINPHGNEFAQRLKKYPSLTKCSTINWIN